MISLNININPDGIVPDSDRYAQEVADSLQEISVLVPEHKESNFVKRLWRYYKRELWKQQGRKCAYCEKSILVDNGHVEHYRPKSGVFDENNKLVTKEAYWWLAYDHRNYIVSCATCNSQKGNKFPIENDKARVTVNNIEDSVTLTNDGALGNEIPYLINPRYNKNPEQHLVYRYTPSQLTPMVHIAQANEDVKGKKTIEVLDLNRDRKNEKEFKDNLPGKRGLVLSNFKKELRKYEKLKEDLQTYRLSQVRNPNANLQAAIEEHELEADRKRQIITELFLSYNSEFSGMCLFWLKNETRFENEFLRQAA